MQNSLEFYAKFTIHLNSSDSQQLQPAHARLFPRLVLTGHMPFRYAKFNFASRKFRVPEMEI